MLNTVAQNRLTGTSPAFAVADSTPSQQGTPPATPHVNTSLKAELGHKQDLNTLGQKLDQIATQLGENATPAAVFTALNTTPMELHPDSLHPSQTREGITVAAYIQSLGLPAPTNHFRLTGLAKAVSDRAMEHPLGDLGGALSWPVPLNADEQTRLRNLGINLGAPAKGGLWAFLQQQIPLSAQPRNNPAGLLDALLSSPQAHASGRALQEQMHGLATGSSASDYLLAALALQLDAESITAPHRNRVAGFDLASTQHVGMQAQAVVERLSQHLISQGKASPALAAAGARLLLSGRAPVFLIKDIPPGVTYGSPAWLNLAVAAATIEAQTPGKVGNMTFAQVMLDAQSAAAAAPALTERAQQAALLDWGVANGVTARKDDDLYTSDDLAGLIKAFNTRSQLMTSAVEALDAHLPSRRDMALAVLKQRFPGKEALFEEKSIYVMTRHDTYTEGGKGVGYGQLVTGHHSMLDIAMMDLKHPDLVFRCTDSRIPIAELNANNRFGVGDAFNQQFDQHIRDKKTAVATTVKHLITQLPPQDRKNFEYGAVSFFQNTSHRLGSGFTDKTQLPPGQELLVSITRDGVTTAYQINFAKGVIAPVSTALARVCETRKANVVHQTQAFGQVLQAPAGVPAEDGVPDSFVSSRTQAIADTFVNHLDFDNPQLKAQARGVTTLDRHEGLVERAGDLLLNLIPFRSAIINFQQGNYGDAAFDLALDVFGFVTAGVGVAGKVAKVTSTALSGANKAFKVGKVIGAATISALNPLSGLGDLAIGTARLSASGVKFLSAKALQGVNQLRGATGSYDLLKAVSKEHGPTLIGTYKIGGVETEGVAVLQNDRWYKYDHVANQPYGLPIDDFAPRGTSVLRAPDGNAGEPRYLKLHNNLTEARTPGKKPAFERGYLNGRLEDIPGYRPGMSSTRLRTLAEAPGRTPEELGILARELKRAYVRDADYTIALLREDVKGTGVSLAPCSQMNYNAHVDLPSVGECAGMSYAMALALELGKEDQLLKNLLSAAAKPNTPAAAKFVHDLRHLQDKVQKSSAFHYGTTPKLVGYDEIIEKMLSSPTSVTLRIGTRDHAMLAGTRIKDGKPEWFFYDPNAGLVTFTNLRAMEAGMENALNSGLTAALHNTDRTLTGKRAYTISVFEPGNLNRPGIDADAVRDLSSVGV